MGIQFSQNDQPSLPERLLQKFVADPVSIVRMACHDPDDGNQFEMGNGLVSGPAERPQLLVTVQEGVKQILL
jgi:hypothetical protein